MNLDIERVFLEDAARYHLYRSRAQNEQMMALRGWKLTGRGSTRTVYAKEGVVVKIGFARCNREEVEAYNKYGELGVFPKLVAYAENYDWVMFEELPFNDRAVGFYSAENHAQRQLLENRLCSAGYEFDNADFNFAADAAGTWKVIDLAGFRKV